MRNKRKIVNGLLVFLLVVLFMTGCFFGPFPQYYLQLKCAHSLAAVLFVIVMVIHIRQHRSVRKHD